MRLSKYSYDEIITLARQNPGFGFREMVKILYPTKHGSGANNTIIQIFNEHKEEYDEDLYSLVQNPKHILVNKKEFIEHGYNTMEWAYLLDQKTTVWDEKLEVFKCEINVTTKEFNWGEVIPEHKRSSHLHRGFKPEYNIRKVNYNYRKIWEMHSDGYSFGEIHRELEINRVMVGKIVKQLESCNEHEILNDWFEVMEIVNWFNSDRGHESHADSIKDEVIIFMRTEIPELKKYLEDPVSNNKPDLKELLSIYNEISEMALETGNNQIEMTSQSEIIKIEDVLPLPEFLPADFPTSGTVTISHKRSISDDNPEGLEEFFVSTQALLYLSKQMEKGKIKFDRDENNNYLIRYLD